MFNSAHAPSCSIYLPQTAHLARPGAAAHMNAWVSKRWPPRTITLHPVGIATCQCKLHSLTTTHSSSTPQLPESHPTHLQLHAASAQLVKGSETETASHSQGEPATQAVPATNCITKTGTAADSMAVLKYNSMHSIPSIHLSRKAGRMALQQRHTASSALQSATRTRSGRLQGNGLITARRDWFKHQLKDGETGRFRFWHDEKRFKGTGETSLVQRALLAARGVRTGGNIKSATGAGPLGASCPADCPPTLLRRTSQQQQQAVNHSVVTHAPGTD